VAGVRTGLGMVDGGWEVTVILRGAETNSLLPLAEKSLDDRRSMLRPRVFCKEMILRGASDITDRERMRDAFPGPAFFVG
jgi:hypothetical protein